jgi:muramoyltetrapeptide carboxypeptidase
MELISPPILKIGDTVGIVAPARKVDRADIDVAVKLLQSWGLNVILGKNLFGEHHQFSGTDSERAADFQSMIENPDVRAIICARGGYGSIRLLEEINLRQLQREPKWVVGYSDITVFHGILNSWYMMETIHATMPINFPKDGTSNISTESLRRALFGEKSMYSIPSHPLNREGVAKGLLCGGNLSILSSLSGTDADIITNDKILFIEDLDEYLYHIDRMMMTLKRSGKLKTLAGIVVGGMTDMRDNTIPFGMDALQIISKAVEEFGYPVCFNFPAGHQSDNVVLIMGRSATLTVKDNGSCLDFSASSCEL